MLDIEKIINQFAGETIDIRNPQRENMLRFQRNIEYVLGLKVEPKDFNKYRGYLALNHYCEKQLQFDKKMAVKQYANHASPCIYTALHLGCYEEVVSYLLEGGGKICIPVTNRVYKGKTVSYYDGLRIRGINPSNLIFVDVESSLGFWEMIHYAKEGYSLLCYIDGNSGIGGMNRNDTKLERIQFFNTRLHVRKGIEYLARLLGRDVVPIYSFIEEYEHKPWIAVMPPVRATKDESITKCMWDVFRNVIWQNFLQWEAWLYIDAFLDVDSVTTDSVKGYALNTSRYSPIVKSGNYYFYDKFTNQLVKVSERLFELLCSIENQQISNLQQLEKIIPKSSLLNDLTEKKILIYR